MQTIEIDKNLIEKAQHNDQKSLDEILAKSEKVIDSAIRFLYLTNGEKEDLKEYAKEGAIKAILAYNGSIPLENFIYVCAKNSAYSAIRKSLSKKNQPLKGYTSLEVDEDGDIDKSKLVISEELDPETEYINKESEEELKKSIKEVLSDLEFKILLLYLDGYSYGEMANEIGKSEKSIDNAIQRIRAKIKKLVKKEK